MADRFNICGNCGADLTDKERINVIQGGLIPWIFCNEECEKEKMTEVLGRGYEPPLFEVTA